MYLEDEQEESEAETNEDQEVEQGEPRNDIKYSLR